MSDTKPDYLPDYIERYSRLLPDCPDELLRIIARETSLGVLHDMAEGFDPQLTAARVDDGKGGDYRVKKWERVRRFGVAVGFKSFGYDRDAAKIIFFDGSRSAGSAWTYVSATGL